MADETARQATLGPQLLTVTGKAPKTPAWDYDKEDLDLIQKLGADYDPSRDRWIYQGKTVIPMKMTMGLVDYLYKLTHLSARKMKTLLDRAETGQYFLNRDGALQQVTDNCRACAQINPGKARIGQGTRLKGHRPGVHWEIDFTEIKPGVTKKLLEIFP